MRTKFFFKKHFRVSKTIAKEFMEWMENEHFPDMHATGCFFGKPHKLMYESEDAEFVEFVEFDYIHFMHSKEEWVEYDTNPLKRTPRKARFGKRFGDQMGKTIFAEPDQIGIWKEVQMVA